ncbi:MAG TPA: glycosyltransferase, partial [Rhodospirillales bacterium]|nr:glycosyltransferase [Rhodospirillales bacterium]
MIHYMTADGIASPWNANEISRVQLAGIPFTLNALRKPDNFSHEAAWAHKMNDETVSIYPLHPLRLVFSLIQAPIYFHGRYFTALFNALFGRRESLHVRITALVHFFVAAYWAVPLRNNKPDHIHSQWAHSGGTVAMYGAWLLDVTFSFTGHAIDLFRHRVALQDKIDRAAFIICISDFHRNFYIDRGADPDKLVIVYCGLDLSLFKPVEKSRSDDVFTILSAGRLVEKKGFVQLIRACGLLRDRGLEFNCLIGGSGPQEAELRRLVGELKLENLVTLTGKALKQERIPEFMSGG